MAGKPQVFKMGGAWIWLCHDHIGGPVGDDFPDTAWRNSWDVCLGAAVKHTAVFHNDIEPIEVHEL